MATYAVGDIQGCYEEFAGMLELVSFDPARDRLWLLGDLINRGSKNLAVVRLVRSLGSAASTILGNHDLHFLAIYYGGHTPNRADTFQDVLEADDVGEIADWYRHQAFLICDRSLGYVMTHAGIPHIWNVERAAELALELESVLRGEHHRRYFEDMYGNEPDCWSADLEGMDRWRCITNYFTRMRLMDADGVLDFSHKGALVDAPAGLAPWFELRARRPLDLKLLFGHWAALEGETDDAAIIALDTGCVWGRELTALCLETGEIHAVAAA